MRISDPNYQSDTEIGQGFQDIYFTNEKTASEHIIRKNKRLRVDSWGMVYFESEITAKFSCSLHFMDFPDVLVKIMFTLAVLTYIFVFQVCSIKIESFSYDTENLGLEWHSPGVEFSNVIEIPQFKLEGKRNS